MGSAVHHPAHYQTASGIEAVDVIEAWGLERSWHLGDATKYILRAGRKGGPEKLIEDLEKANWYLRRFLVRDVDFYPLSKPRFNPRRLPMEDEMGPHEVCSSFALTGARANAVHALYHAATEDNPRFWVGRCIKHIEAAIDEAKAAPPAPLEHASASMSAGGG